MDGKGAFIIRKLLRAYLHNPQQLPDEYIERLVKTEIARLDSASSREIFQAVESQRDKNYTTWKTYECRDVLRIMTKDRNLLKKVSPALSRIIFDYVSEMTDSFAAEQYRELY